MMEVGLARKHESFDWSIGDRAEVLSRMWSAGASVKAIMREVGAPSTRSVIGKVHRLDLPRRRHPDQPRKQPGPGRGTYRQERWRIFWAEGDGWRDAILRRCYTRATARPISIIANTVGCSTSSVMRRAKQLGLRHPGLRGHGMGREKCVTQASGIVHRLPAQKDGSKGMALPTLGANSCRFPTSPHMARPHLFCGCEVETPGHVYCDFHHAIAHREPVAEEAEQQMAA